MLGLALGTAWAGEHDAAAPAAVELEAAAVPIGPPIERRASAGDDLRAIVGGLPAGSTLTLEPGVHRGPLVIDRTLELRGEPGAILDGGGQGTVLTVVAPGVWVHDFEVRGGGFQPQQDDAGVVLAGDGFKVERLQVRDVYLGIDVRRADEGLIRDCRIVGDQDASFGLRGDGIRLWETTQTVVEHNTLLNVRDLVVWYSDHNVLRDNTVRGSRYGTHLMHTTGNVIVDNGFELDVVGVFVMYSDDVLLRGNTVVGSHGEAGVGFGFKESSGVVVEDNTLVDNTTGLYLDTTPHRQADGALVRHNLIGANDQALRLHGRSDGAVFTQNDFRGNRSLAQVDGHVSLEHVSFEGNHWSEYEGYDLDHDGTGDLPFQVREVVGALEQRYPAFTYFEGTPAQSMLELFSEAFPMFAPAPLFTDPRPLVAAP